MASDDILRLPGTPGQFAKAVVWRDTAYLAGIIPERWDADITGQAQEVFARIDAALEAAGTTRARLLSMTVYLRSFEDYDGFRTAYEQWIDQDALPARATVRADLRDPRIRIEIMAIAAL